MSASFTYKALRATLALVGANQTFQGTNDNTLVLEDMRMSAALVQAGNYNTQLDLTIFGMRQADMNALTILWAGPNPTSFALDPTVLLETNDGSGWKQAFQGNFVQAQPDYRNIPDADLAIHAMTGASAQYAATDPSSYPGAASAAVIAQNLATAMDFTLENNGVTAQLSTPYFHGTLMDQFNQLCQQANIDYYFLPGASPNSAGVIAITPKNQSRQNQSSVLLSRATGLIGYPTIQQYGISAQCLYNPAITLAATVRVDTDGAIPGADGTWFPQYATHQLESWTPGGAWFSDLSLYPTSAIATAANS